MLPAILIGMGGGIILLLGSLHLVYTFRGPKLRPRDPAVERAMNRDSPGISRDTTMWRAWVGFNASHSLGALLFALVYAYLAAFEPDLLFGSVYLLVVGAGMLGALLVLARRYWFPAPLTGIFLALACYLAGVAAWWL